MANDGWTPLKSDPGMVMYNSNPMKPAQIQGWVVLIDDKWIARSSDGNIRADFDTMEEAQQFLKTMIGANT